MKNNLIQKKVGSFLSSLLIAGLALTPMTAFAVDETPANAFAPIADDYVLGAFAPFADGDALGAFAPIADDYVLGAFAPIADCDALGASDPFTVEEVIRVSKRQLDY